MKDAAKLSKKNGPVAPIAEAKKPSEDAVEPIADSVEQPVNVTFANRLRAGIPQEKIDMAKGLGIPLDDILTWMDGVDRNFEILAETNQKLMPLVQFAQQLQAQPTPNLAAAAANPGQTLPVGQPPANTGGLMGQISQLAPLLPYIMGKGDSSDDFWKDLGKQSMMADITLSRTLKNVLMSGLVSRQVKPIIDNTLGP